MEAKNPIKNTKILMIIMICLLIFSMSFGWWNGWVASKKYNKCMFIPDSDLIIKLCQKSGYKYGWLSSSVCGRNQIQCYKELGNAKYFDCINVEPFNFTKSSADDFPKESLISVKRDSAESQNQQS